jgi:Zn ribbon nucleic-acid-binding protein
MASVIDYIECPNCKSEAWCDFYYKTGEEYISCNNCGYHRSATIKNREKRLDQLTESDWKITELKTPYGAYRLKTYSSIATQCGSLNNKIAYNQLKDTIIRDTDIQYCSVSRYLRGKIVEEIIIDNSSNSNLNNEHIR